MFEFIKKAREQVETKEKGVIAMSEYIDLLSEIHEIRGSKSEEISGRANVLTEILDFLRQAQKSEETEKIFKRFDELVGFYIEAADAFAYLKKWARVAARVRKADKKRTKHSLMDIVMGKTGEYRMGVGIGEERALLKEVKGKREDLKSLHALVEQIRERDAPKAASGRYWEETGYGRKHVISDDQDKIVIQIQIYPGRSTWTGAEREKTDELGMVGHQGILRETVKVTSAEGECVKYTARDRTGNEMATRYFGFGAEFDSVNGDHGYWHVIENTSKSEIVDLQITAIRQSIDDLKRD